MDKNQRERVISCAVSAALSIAVGVFVLYITSKDRQSIGIGIFMFLIFGVCAARQIYMIKNAEKSCYFPDRPNSPSIMKKIDKIRAYHMKTEVWGKLSLEKESTNPGTGGCFGAKGNYQSIMEAAVRLGVPFEAILSDYVNAEVFRSNGCVLSVGVYFTIYCKGGDTFLIKNSDIIAVTPYIENTDMYMNLIFTGIVQRFMVRVFVADGRVFTFNLPDLSDRLVIEAYAKRKEGLSPNCLLFDYSAADNSESA